MCRFWDTRTRLLRLQLCVAFLLFITVIPNRHLTIGDFASINDVLLGTEFQLPPMSRTEDSTTLRLSSIRCRNVQIGDVQLESAASTTGLNVTIRVVELDVVCEANYNYNGRLLAGEGDVQVTSRQNSVTVQAFVGKESTTSPPTSIQLNSCISSVNINDIEFSNGGFLGWVLNLIERLARSIMEDLIQDTLCQQLLQALDKAEDSLDQINDELLNYPVDASVDPLQAEQDLDSNPQLASQLVDFTNPQTDLGRWLHQALDQGVAFLRATVNGTDSTTDMRVNSLLRDNILNENHGLDLIDEPKTLFYNQDILLETRIQLERVQLLGLDTIVAMDPISTIGRHTIQSNISWELLALSLNLTVDMRPSTLDDSVVTGGQGLLENVHVVVGLAEIKTTLALLGAFHQQRLASLRLGSLLSIDNLFPCLLSTVERTRLSSFCVEAGDILSPYISGIDSIGIQRILGNVVDIIFDLYEMVVLQRSPAMFQQDFRELLNQRFLEKYLQSRATTCPIPEHNTGGNAPKSFVDFRDLLLTPAEAFLRGGAGTEPYGDLLPSFVIPNLQAQVMTADLFNERIIRTATRAQSGVAGSLQWPDWVLYNYTSSSTKLYEGAVLLISNIRIYNLDTITSPLNILDARDWNELFQTVTFANETRQLQVSISVFLAIGDESSPLSMKNHVDITLEIPRISTSFGVTANMKEDAFLNFSLVDITNPFCWLGTLAPHTSVQESGESTTLNPLVIETLTFLVDTFRLSSECVNCSSAGAFLLADILQNDLPAVGFQNVFSERIFKFLEYMIGNMWRDHDQQAMLDDAAHKCPKRASDGRILFPLQEGHAKKEFTRKQRKSLLEIPLESRDSVETLVGLGMVGMHVAAIVVAGNYIPVHPVEEYYFANREEEWSTEEFNSSSNEGLFDWTNMSSDNGPGAYFAFEQLRRLLSESVEYETDDGNVKSTPRLTYLLRKYVLDEKAAYVIDLVRFDGALKALGVEFLPSQVQLLGLENLVVGELLIPIKPQQLRTKVHLDELTMIVDSTVHLGDMTKDVQFVFVAKNITMQIDLSLALDLDAIEALQLGSLFQIGDIVPCATMGLKDVYVHQLLISTEAFEGPLVDGFNSNDFLTSVDTMIHNLSRRHTKVFQAAMPAFFNSTVRGIANTLLPGWVNSIKNNCPPPPHYPDGGFVDFRDLLLPGNSSRALGGTGSEPYGNLFHVLYGSFTQHLSQNGGSHRPVINDLLRFIAANQSNAQGAFKLQGNAFSLQTKVNIAGLRANLEFQVSNVTMKNIDSIGEPLELVKPIKDSADTVSNILALGVDSRTLQMAATVYVSLSDGAEMNIKNKLQISWSVGDLVVMAEIALKISERAFAAFPFGELTNIECWLATILSRPATGVSAFGGIRVEEHSLSIRNFTFDVHCIECTSPNFDKMLVSLYSLKNITEMEEDSEGLLDTEIFPVLLDRIVEDASRRCPHHPTYDPDGKTISFLSSPADSLGLIQIASTSKNPAFFNILNSVIAVLLFLACVVGRWLVRQSNKKWIKSLSSQGRLMLKRQQERDLAMEKFLDSSTNALISCSCIPLKVRCGVPIAIFLNTVLYLAGHLGTLSVVHLEASLAGQAFTIHNFLEFHFLKSTTQTYHNGGAEIAILLWIFTGIWPYIKLMMSILLWIIPPSRLSVRRRGQALLWIDALAKLSVIDIFTILLSFAIMLVFSGGPDASLRGTANTFYTLKIIVVPGAGFYCLLVAQRMSRVSSRFLLEYHDLAISAASNEHSGHEGSNDSTSLSTDLSIVHDDDSAVPIVPIDSQEPHESDQRAGLSTLLPNMAAPTGCGPIEDGLAAPSTDRWCHDSSTSEPSLQQNSVRNVDQPSDSVQGQRWGTLGAFFCIITIGIILVIGCILAPAISFDTSSLTGLAVESNMTFEDVASEYGVFLVISSILVRARFLLARKADYVGLGFLLAGAFVSTASVFFIKAYFFFKRRLEHWRIGSVTPTYGHRGCGLPLYFRLHKWKYMEIYCISLSIGVWQLGSACSYVIYMYCDILRRIYSVLEYLGLSEESAAQCSLLQVALPGNLIIICCSLLLLLLTFFFQALAQYKKNIKDALRCVDTCSLPTLSVVWSFKSSKNSRSSFQADVVSRHSQETIHSTIPALETSLQTVEGSRWSDDASNTSPQHLSR